jgi:predicted RNA-binding Zn-ribbon protein involved in translation (DUF1610 family)
VEAKEAGEVTICPGCQTIVRVPADWRLVQCPGCGQMITRMADDSAFD